MGARAGLTIAMGCVFLAGAVPAGAQVSAGAPAAPDSDDPRDWQVSAGVGAIVIPEYEGSRDLRVIPIPALDVTWRNTVFLNPVDGIGVYAVNNDRLMLGAGVTYGIGRYEEYSPRLRGLGDVADAPRPRVFGRIYSGPLSVGAGVSRDIGGSDGLLADVSLDVALPVSSNLLLRAGAAAIYADGKHMRSFFGVSPAQSASSGLPQFTADAGFKRADATLGATLRLSRRWALTVNGGAGRLLGDAARSPVIERKWQPFGFAGLTYSF